MTFEILTKVEASKGSSRFDIEQDNGWVQRISPALSKVDLIGYLGAKYGRQIDQIKTANDLDHGGGSAEVVKR